VIQSDLLIINLRLQTQVYNNMIKTKVFPFNAFQVNTVVLYEENGECVIIDPACDAQHEQQQLTDFIKEQKLTPVKALNTHCHIDHILGCNFVCEHYNIPLEIHEAGQPFLDMAPQQGPAYGFSVDTLIKPAKYLNEGDIIKVGGSELHILYTPGHADGSLCFIDHNAKLIVAGDVLFNGSIGRTDLPTGNFEILKENIQQKLFVLDDDFRVICGHGPDTTIGFEKRNNPFVALGL